MPSALRDVGFWSEMDHAAAVLTLVGALVATYRRGRRMYRKAITRRRSELPASHPVDVKLNLSRPVEN
jgi:hypothetical protein